MDPKGRQIFVKSGVPPYMSYCIILSFLYNSPLPLILHTFFVFAVSLAPPPPSILQVTPQLPLMGFVARVQENSKFMSSLCCRSDYRHRM